MSEYKELKYEYEIGKSAELEIETQSICLYLPMEEYRKQIAAIQTLDETEYERYVDEAGWEDWMEAIDDHHKATIRADIEGDDDYDEDYIDNDELLEWTINTIKAIQALLWRDVYGQGSTPSINPVPLQNKQNTPPGWFG